MLQQIVNPCAGGLVRGVGRETQVVDPLVYGRAVQHLGERGIVLPTFSQLANPDKIHERVREALAAIGPDDAHPLNLFRVHWFNDQPRTGEAKVPEHVVLPPELTGVEARIVVAFGDRFPMIGAHKVLAAYGCLAPLVVTGQFDPTSHRAVWPSTGNYCRGGDAISRIMGCRGVAVLPEGMSRERFDWLADWVVDPNEDIIRTPGTESNVKEIYDECARLAADPRNVILNQFSEFGNYLAHFLLTGTALGHVYESLHEADQSLRLRAFVSASGSAGTLGAGDYLKEQYGSQITAVEALECPTMLYAGFGEHNIQGIGDKHIPLIHNVMNTDVATAVSDQATDQLHLLFNSAEGRSYLVRRRGVPEAVVDTLPSLGLSSICNVLGAIKTARYYGLGAEDVIVTVATDGSRMYRSEIEIAERKYFPDGFDGVAAGEVFGQHVIGASTEHLQELSRRDRERVFNLGYYTWVEQQGVSVEDFEARRPQRFWRELRGFIPVWDQMIEDFNGRSGAADGL